MTALSRQKQTIIREIEKMGDLEKIKMYLALGGVHSGKIDNISDSIKNYVDNLGILDWQIFTSPTARVRVYIKRILRKNGYFGSEIHEIAEEITQQVYGCRVC